MKNSKTPKWKIKKRLEKEVKQYVKERDNYTCQHCWKEWLSWHNCHASHVIPVSADGRLAFNPRNLKVLCYHCHMNWWHKNPVEAWQRYRDTFQENWEYLHDKYVKKQMWSISLTFYDDQLEEIRKLQKSLAIEK